MRKSRPGLGGPLIPTPLLLPSCLLGEGRTQKPDLSSLQPLPPLPQFPPGLKEAKENRALLRLPLSLPLPHFLLGEDGLLAPPSPPWQILALVSSFCRAPRVKRLDSNWTLLFLSISPFSWLSTPDTKLYITVAPPCVEIRIFRRYESPGEGVFFGDEGRMGRR